MKYVPPSVKSTAFNCPHCGAFAKQNWFSVHADKMKRDETPEIIGVDFEKTHHLDGIADPETQRKVKKWLKSASTGRPLLETNNAHRSYSIYNVWLSDCFNCSEFSVWIYDRLVYPQRAEALPANPDLPDEIRRDYEEASAILDVSPRGAAALIRLAIQKLCRELGQPGENINADIKALVASGLDPRVQKALDAVRVIGNNAVHPGQIDLSDDRATAESLFRLVNLIAEKMISEPKHVDEVYSTLPESARLAIQKRDGAL